MHRLTYITFLLVLLGTAAPAQEKKGLSYYDKITYDAYLRGDWHEVIRAGRAALEEGLDYYYLRMRLGIACYTLKNYHQAIRHFRKALSFNRKDVTAMKYLYYAYLFSGREADRRALINHMPARLRDEINTGRISGLIGLELSAEYFTNNDRDGVDDYDPAGLPDEKGYQSFVRQGGSGALLFTTLPGENTTLSLGYRFLSKDRFLYLHNDEGEYTLPDNTFTQHQLYGSLAFRLAEGLNMSLSFNYLNLRTAIPTTAYGNRLYMVTASTGDFTSYLLLRKDLPYLSLYGGAGLSGMNNATQLQTDAGVVVYPFGNLNLYFGSGITYLIQGSFSGGMRQQEDIIWSPFAGFRIAGTLWGELFATTGDISNYQSALGWMLYNEQNPVSFSSGLNLTWVIPKNGMMISFSPLWSKAASRFFPADDITNSYYPIDYQMLNFKIKIKWNF